MSNLFVYGSLMLPDVFHAVTRRSFRHMEGSVSGYARYRIRGESFPGLVPLPGATTAGIVYLDVDAGSIARLDRFEGKWYRRTPVRVATPGARAAGEVDATAYVVAPAHRHRVSNEPWSLEEFREKLLDEFLGDYPGFERIER